MGEGQDARRRAWESRLLQRRGVSIMEDLIQQIGLPIIAILVPLVIALIKKGIPPIPTFLLPIIAAALGPAFDLGIAALAGIETTGVLAVVAGLAGFGLGDSSEERHVGEGCFSE